MSKSDIRQRFREYASGFDDSVSDAELDEFLDEFADMIAAREHRLRYEEKEAKERLAALGQPRPATRLRSLGARMLSTVLPSSINHSQRVALEELLGDVFSEVYDDA